MQSDTKKADVVATSAANLRHRFWQTIAEFSWRRLPKNAVLASQQNTTLAEARAMLQELLEEQEELQRAADALAEGDLLFHISARKELGLSASFRSMVDRLRLIIGTVATHAEGVAVTSGKLAIAAECTSNAATEIVKVIEEVAEFAMQNAEISRSLSEGSSQQRETTKDTIAAMDELNLTVAEVSTSAEAQSELAKQTNTSSIRASEAANQVLFFTKHMIASAEEASEIAESGVAALELTVKSIRSIAVQMDVSAGRVRELSKKGAGNRGDCRGYRANCRANEPAGFECCHRSSTSG